MKGKRMPMVKPGKKAQANEMRTGQYPMKSGAKKRLPMKGR